MHAWIVALGLGIGCLVMSGGALADGTGGTGGHIPAGGGLDAVDAHATMGEAVLHVKVGAATRDVKIPTDVDVMHATYKGVPVGEGRSVMHVRIPDRARKDLAFEALISGKSAEPIWAGLTGYTQGSEGDRAGDVILVYDRDAQTKFVIVAETREDTRICGQQVTPLGARGLDAHTMELRGATLHRIDKAARDAAQKIVALPRAADAKNPLARVLSATGGSAPNAPALTDGDPRTGWTEQRPGDGHGEFVTMRVPSELALKSLLVTVAPPTPGPDGAAPRTFFVATDEKLFHVTMPEDAWSKPGATYEIPLPVGSRTTCVALVLDEAYARGLAAPEVTLVELGALTTFDAENATLDDVAKALDGPRAEEAAALLRRSGEDGLAAVAKRFTALDARARALAVDVAASAGACEGGAAELLTQALTDRELEVRRRALGRLERCGKSAAPALVLAVKSDDEARRAAAAPLLATFAPSLALEPLAGEMGKGAPETRRAVRAGFTRAAASSTRDKLLGLLANKELTPAARLDLLRAMGKKVGELRPESDAALAELLKAAPDMATRYLLVGPLAQLAHAPDATPGELSRLADLALHDPAWPVRAHAVELAAGIGPLVPIVIQATSDPEPRVREAALRTIAASGAATGTGAAAQALGRDEWTFVRVAAADALGAMPNDVAAAQAVASGLGDKSSRVRAAAVAALGKLRASGQAASVRERLDDTKEDPEVRALAARALGVMCASGEADRLTKLAQRAAAPVDETDDRLGMAAIEALGALHPGDLAKRLGPLREKNVRVPVRRAVERALAEPGSCH